MPTTKSAIQYKKGKLSKKILLELYEQLLRPRMIEEKMLILLRSGKISKCYVQVSETSRFKVPVLPQVFDIILEVRTLVGENSADYNIFHFLAEDTHTLNETAAYCNRNPSGAIHNLKRTYRTCNRKV